MKTYNVKLEIQVVDVKKGVIMQQINTDWAIKMIKQVITSKTASDKDKLAVLDEYVKYSMMKSLKIENYPIINRK